ncbi:MAG: serine/threonine protein phosphatase [Oscillospiraceae bacterium]|nr:serine/threonine protein phosphatase [Oscillospiraceae bacterium]
MNIFKKNKKHEEGKVCTQTSRGNRTNINVEMSPESQFGIYSQIRESIPIVDAAINKIIRLVGDFKIESENEFMTQQVDHFLKNVLVIGNGNGMHSFMTCYLDSMLTFGNALGEIVLDPMGREIVALFNVSMRNIRLRREDASLETEFWISRRFDYEKIKHPELLVFSTLNPVAGEIYGNSLIKGLPFVSEILLKIYKSIGLNFDRVGNVRFAINYKPNQNSMDADCAQEIAQNIASQWEQAMRDCSDGVIRDFVSVGDVDIKVIGADNNIISTEVPVRQMLEQIVAKMGIPPFLLGLNWSTTERMSKQQSDILISEIESYRRTITPCISKIVKTWSRLSGFDDEFEVVWRKINLYDEITQAKTQLMLNQAKRIETA